MKRFFVGVGVFLLVAACGGAVQPDVLGGGSSSSSSGGSSGGGSSSGGGGGKTFAEITSCTKPGECELGGAGCCGRTCGSNQQTIAIRRGEAESLRQLTCAETGPVACPACAPAPDPEEQAFCEGGKCIVVDIPAHPISDCSAGGECELAWGECCPPCGTASGEMLIAVRKGNTAALRSQLCSGTERCPDCAGRFPSGYRAVCDAGQCYVDQL